MSEGNSSYGATVFGVSVDTGSAPITNVKILSTADDIVSTATATVTPDASDPTEAACLHVSQFGYAAVPSAPVRAMTKARVALAATPATITPSSCKADGGVPVQIFGCPAPTITSITPSTWFAGKTYEGVKITGTNFITKKKKTDACPETLVSATTPDGSEVKVTDINVESDKKITVTMVPDANTTTEQATVTVGTAPNTGTSATLATQPQILGNEIQCDSSMNCTQPVISKTKGTPPAQDADVGERIALIANPNLPAAFKPFDMKWTIGGTKIGGYTPTPTSYATGSVTQVKDDDLKKNDITFYWVYPNSASAVSIPVTYSYCVNIPGASPVKQCSLAANASFNLSGPGDAQMDVNPYHAVSVDSIKSAPCMPITYLNWMEYGKLSGWDPVDCGDWGTETGKRGMVFKTPPDTPLPAGKYSFVQTIAHDTVTYQFGMSSHACPTYPGLDAKYPYPKSTDDPEKRTTYDSPGVPLSSSLSGVQRTFRATMYLLWTSTKDGAIPVPISSQDWQISGAHTQNSSYKTGEVWDDPRWQALGPIGDMVDYVNTSPGTTPYGYPTWKRPATLKPDPIHICPVDTGATVEETETQEEDQ
jgi:hypothetical protein